MFRFVFRNWVFNPEEIIMGGSTNLVCWACEKQNENIIKECIEMKYNLNEENVYAFCSPLIFAVRQKNNLNIIKLLVRNGADLNYVNYLGKCVFDYTSNEQYLSVLNSSGGIRIEKQKSKLAIEIENNKKCSVTTKEAVNQIDARGLTPFLWAILYKRQNYVDYYMKLGADVNQAGTTGITPLMMAVRSGNFGIVKKLVESGANCNQLDNNGLPAIAYFLCDDDDDYDGFYYLNEDFYFEISNYLLRNRGKIDPCISGYGRSPLIEAAIQNNFLSFNYFLNQNANVHFIDSDGNSVLSYAILNENTSHAAKLIAKGADVDACGPKGKSPLAWSVFINNPEITQFLLDNKADINYTDHQGRTALYYAEKYQYTEIIKLLKDNGAKPITITQNNDIFSAIQAKDIDSIKNLLDNLNIYQKNEENQTVIDVALQVSDLNIINLLLEKKSNLFIHTALPTAIQNKNIQLVKFLLEKGAKVDRIYKKTNQSPLLQAINQQNEDIVELLLKFNANVRTGEDPSPFQRALQLGKEKIIKMLIEKTVNVNEAENGKTFLQMAIDENNIGIIMFLLEKGADPQNCLDSLKQLAEEFEELEILLEDVSRNFHQENVKQKTNKTESN